MRVMRLLRSSLVLLILALPALAVGSVGTTPSFEVYGFAQLDYIQDFKRVNPDWDATLRPSRIPTGEGTYGSDGQSILSARQSRLGVMATLPTGAGDVFTKFEFDLFGVGDDEGQTTIRLRHAYGQFGPILAGQTNSLFMDVNIFPNVIDYWGPCGMVFLRNPQVRWTQGFGKSSLAVALEQPSNDIDTGNLPRDFDPSLVGQIQGDEKYPDLTAQLHIADGWGHVQLAGIGRRVGYETVGTDDNRPKGYEIGWGADLTSVIKLRKSDALRLGVVYGKGIASYLNDGGMDLAPNKDTATDISAVAVPLLGVSAYYDLAWSDKFTSSIGYAITQVDNTNYQDDTAFHQGQYGSVNVIYYPTKNVFYGVEYLYGRREDNGGDSGSDHRVQFSAHYGFSSKDFASKPAEQQEEKPVEESVEGPIE